MQAGDRAEDGVDRALDEPQHDRQAEQRRADRARQAPGGRQHRDDERLQALPGGGPAAEQRGGGGDEQTPAPTATSTQPGTPSGRRSVVTSTPKTTTSAATSSRRSATSVPTASEVALLERRAVRTALSTSPARAGSALLPM